MLWVTPSVRCATGVKECIHAEASRLRTVAVLDGRDVDDNDVRGTLDCRLLAVRGLAGAVAARMQRVRLPGLKLQKHLLLVRLGEVELVRVEVLGRGRGRSERASEDVWFPEEGVVTDGAGKTPSAVMTWSSTRLKDLVDTEFSRALLRGTALVELRDEAIYAIEHLHDTRDRPVSRGTRR